VRKRRPGASPSSRPETPKDLLSSDGGAEGAGSRTHDIVRRGRCAANYVVEVGCTPTQCTIGVPQGPLFRMRPREVQVSLSAVIKKGEPWDEPTKTLVQDLEKIGVKLAGNRPRAPLELLADDRTREEFLALMERHLETLTG
jgi:hypothetical protein